MWTSTGDTGPLAFTPPAFCPKPPQMLSITSKISFWANIFSILHFSLRKSVVTTEVFHKIQQNLIASKYGSSGTEKALAGHSLGLPSSLWDPGSETSNYHDPVISFNPEWWTISTPVLPSLQWQVQIHFDLYRFKQCFYTWQQHWYTHLSNAPY